MNEKKSYEFKKIVSGATIKRKYAKRRHLLGDKVEATNIPPKTTRNEKDGMDR